MASVTLDALVSALRRRGTPLASESALFVALECAEALSESAARALDPSLVRLDPEGRVDVSASPATDDERSMLRSIGALVRVLCDPLPAIAREFVLRTEDGSIASLASAQSELEALLVPLNRGAARRVIARHVREVSREGTSERPIAREAPSASSAIDSAATTHPLGDAQPSSVDTEPEGAPLPATSSMNAMATVADVTPLPAKLPPPPRLGSLASLPIGPGASDDSELPSMHAASPSPEDGADRTVLDGALQGVDERDERTDDSAAVREGASRASPAPLLLVAVFFLLALVFFLWRVSMH
jgi:hypothetical protein